MATIGGVTILLTSKQALCLARRTKSLGSVKDRQHPWCWFPHVFEQSKYDETKVLLSTMRKCFAQLSNINHHCGIDQDRPQKLSFHQPSKVPHKKSPRKSEGDETVGDRSDGAPSARTSWVSWSACWTFHAWDHVQLANDNVQHTT